MSVLWWLRPGWNDADCPCCGGNIWKRGGDPDMGICPDCYEERRADKEPEQPSYLCVCNSAHGPFRCQLPAGHDGQHRFEDGTVLVHWSRNATEEAPAP